MTRNASVDRDRIVVPDGFTGSVDVWFGDHRGWSFTVTEPGVPVRWPRTMRGFLTGWSDVRLVGEEQELFADRVVFTDSPDELRMVDKHGIPVIIDKWGLVQRPFEFRAAGLVEALADDSAEIMAVIERELGLPTWISFGTLLGAARSGRAIGHDSDVDLCYLSSKATPAEMSVELWQIGRVLRAAGWSVSHKSGSFLTVEVEAADGASVGIDVYGTFFLDGLFHETATVRAPVPREAVLPITPIEFEGRMLNGPASPEKLLEVSYGPNWRVPDPSFKHEPGPEILDRFDGWFGHLWRQRRDWRSLNRADSLVVAENPPELASEFAVWLVQSLPFTSQVNEVGAGTGTDALAVARSGFRVRALDYAFGPRGRFPEHPRLSRHSLNLYDRRDVMVRGAILARTRRPQALVARDLLETLAPEGLDHFFQLAKFTLAGGGELALEGHAWPQAALEARPATGQGGRVFGLDPADVLARATALGGTLVHAEGLEEAAAALADGTGSPVRWRLLLTWPVPARWQAAIDAGADDPDEDDDRNDPEDSE